MRCKRQSPHMSHLEGCEITEESEFKEEAKHTEERSNPQFLEELPASLHENIGKASVKRTETGDLYIGTCKFGLPDGFGKYFWSDGCTYEGEWIAGKATGRGKMSWPSGTTYDGEFLAGNMHGVGTFEGHGNTVYKGSWVMNVEHGLGRKLYSNGDVYEGLWKQGLQDGIGRYSWKEGNMYYGEWKRGNMCGQGCLTWEGKDSYHGRWQDGLAHGHGTYIWADGSAYSGLWSRGKKDGKGIFYPPGSHHPTPDSLMLKSIDTTTHDLKKLWNPRRSPLWQRFGRIRRSARKFRSLPAWSEPIEKQLMQNVQVDVVVSDGSVSADTGNVSCSHHMEGTLMTVLEREYAEGVLIGELSHKNVQSTGSSQSGIPWQKHSMQAQRKVGEKIVKGHRSYDLMLNLQLGIRYSVGRIKEGWDAELCLSDCKLREKEQIFFPRKGSQKTPPHHSKDFRWTDYCPGVFRKIRKIFEISEVDYLMSLCGNDGLRELSSAGKSGSVFYISDDNRYMIKTLRTSEVKVLLRMLWSYYDHLCKHAETLITRFFGLHQVLPDGGKKIQVVIMGNIFWTELRIHRKFDLKGSLEGRSSKNIQFNETTVLKDQDLNFDFYLEPTWRLTFFESIKIASSLNQTISWITVSC